MGLYWQNNDKSRSRKKGPRIMAQFQYFPGEDDYVQMEETGQVRVGWENHNWSFIELQKTALRDVKFSSQQKMLLVCLVSLLMHVHHSIWHEGKLWVSCWSNRAISEYAGNFRMNFFIPFLFKALSVRASCFFELFQSCLLGQQGF